MNYFGGLGCFLNNRPRVHIFPRVQICCEFRFIFEFRLVGEFIFVFEFRFVGEFRLVCAFRFVGEFRFVQEL